MFIGIYEKQWDPIIPTLISTGISLVGFQFKESINEHEVVDGNYIYTPYCVSNIEIANKIHFIGLNLGYFLRVVFSKLDIS